MKLQILFGTLYRPWLQSEIGFVLSVLNDKRSWGVPVAQSVDTNAPVVFYLASSQQIGDMYGDQYGKLSLTDRRNPLQYIVYFNLMNWEHIPELSKYTSLSAYRIYVVNHEFGHVLGHGHAECPGPGNPSPVMKQQTLGTGVCVACVWPALCGDLSSNK